MCGLLPPWMPVCFVSRVLYAWSNASADGRPFTEIPCNHPTIWAVVDATIFLAVVVVTAVIGPRAPPDFNITRRRYPYIIPSRFNIAYGFCVITYTGVRWMAFPFSKFIQSVFVCIVDRCFKYFSHRPPMPITSSLESPLQTPVNRPRRSNKKFLLYRSYWNLSKSLDLYFIVSVHPITRF